MAKNRAVWLYITGNNLLTFQVTEENRCTNQGVPGPEKSSMCYMVADSCSMIDTSLSFLPILVRIITPIVNGILSH